MKLVSLLFILLLSVSCGQKSSGGGGGEGGTSKREAEAGGGCNLNGEMVDCKTLQGPDGLGIDLLEAMIDVPIKVDSSEITFLADKSSLANGRRINCEIKVKNGEVYRYVLRDDVLTLMTERGTIDMKRLSGSGLNGTWKWKGYVDRGTYVIRHLTLIGNNKAVLRNTCEL
jgi:hypothetical protein